MKIEKCISCGWIPKQKTWQKQLKKENNFLGCGAKGLTCIKCSREK